MPQEVGTSEAEVLEALKSVKYPGMSRNIVSFGFVKELSVQDGRASFVLAPTTEDPDIRAQIAREARAAVEALPGVRQVIIREPEEESEPAAGGVPASKPVPGIKSIVAVASGKGGVGKSTVAVNLAVALAKLGARVGLLDADIYGPSIPLMMGAHEQPTAVGGRIIPLERYGVKLISIGFFVPQDRPVIWRGPMVMRAVEQLLRDVEWGELDALIVDLPPGTGDAQLTLAQQIGSQLSSAVIVTTPQDVALVDATKGVEMFRQLDVPIEGIIENMSYFACPHCGERTDIFSHGGGKAASERLGVPFLGEIPIDPQIRRGGDEGEPVVVAAPDSPQAGIFFEIARNLVP